MTATRGPTIAVVGAAGDLGMRVAKALSVSGTTVRALVRPGTNESRLDHIVRTGASPVPVALEDPIALRRALEGAQCVVSTLNGLGHVILQAQSQLLSAAVAVGVPRFIPSDFSADFTRTRPGDNRNLDLRRRFMDIVDRTPITATSVLNGGFIDLLAGQAPIVVLAIRRVVHFGDASQKLDFTAKDDVAAYTASVALDEAAPRILRIAGDSVSPAELTQTMTDLTGQRFRTLRIGGIAALSTLIHVTRALTPSSDEPFPAWQGMQYLRDMMGGRGKLDALDNERYGTRKWISARRTLTDAFIR